MTQKTRGEMDPRHQWELSHIFQDRAAWEAALEKAQQAVAGIGAYRGTLGSVQGAKAAWTHIMHWRSRRSGSTCTQS